jgi:LysM repeat protein
MTLAQSHLLPLSGNNMNRLQQLFFGLMLFCVSLGFTQTIDVVPEFFSYRVKPGDSRWNMAQDFGISLDSLWKLNPHLSEYSMELPVGIVITLPKKEINSSLVNLNEVESSASFRRIDPFEQAVSPDSVYVNTNPYPAIKPYDQIPFIDSLLRPYEMQLMFALPFRIDKMNYQDSLVGQKTIEARRDMKLSLGFYTGALMAIDSLQSLGIYVTPRPIDTQLDATVLFNKLHRDSLGPPDAIIGPLLPSNQSVLLNYARAQNIPAVLPVVSSGPFDYEKAFYPVPKESVLREKLLSFAQKTYGGEKVFLIADAENTTAASAIKDLFPRAFEVELINNISVEIDTFATELDSVIPNWVFVESQNLKLVSSVSSILNANITEKVKIKMFTTNTNKAFENDVIDNQHLSALHFTFPTFYKNTRETPFTRAYERKFGSFPDPLTVRGFDLTMDLVLKMAYPNGILAAQAQMGPTWYVDHIFHYSPLFSLDTNRSSGFYNQASFIMTYEEMDVKLVE